MRTGKRENIPEKWSREQEKTGIVKSCRCCKRQTFEEQEFNFRMSYGPSQPLISTSSLACFVTVSMLTLCTCQAESRIPTMIAVILSYTTWFACFCGFFSHAVKIFSCHPSILCTALPQSLRIKKRIGDTICGLLIYIYMYILCSCQL